MYNFDEPDQTNVVRMDINAIIVHEDWDTNSKTYDADLAVLLLKNSLKYTDYISPICLPTSSSSLSGGTIAGWGRAFAERDTENAMLYALMNPPIDNELCREETLNVASKRSFCSKGLENRGTCKGDSGFYENSQLFF